MQMKIQIEERLCPTKSQGIAAHKIECALARYALSIREASVRLDDINEPNWGGVDKPFRVVLMIKDCSVGDQ